MNYLEDHGINKSSIEKFGLIETSEKVVIPVKDEFGQVLFNKYRLLSSIGGNKYSYDSGSKASLFNCETLKENDFVVITEGEMDAIRLEQEGIPAVSSTSGAGVFKEEWVDLFKGKKVFICYDNDKPGKEGSVKVSKMLYEREVEAYQVDIPQGQNIKDVCDYLKLHTKEEFLNLLKQANKFEIPFDLKLISLEDLLATEFPKVKWLVEDLIPSQGLIAISGTPGSYKTWITEHIALCVSEGKNVFNHFTTTQGSVLIIDKENSKWLIQERFKILGAKLNKSVFFLDEDFLVEEEEIVSKIRKFIRLNNIKLVILDSFIRVHRGEENSASDMSEVFSVLKAIIDEGCSILFTHHHRKQSFFGKANNADSLRGSTDILAALDCHLAVDKLEDGIKVTQPKLRHKEAIKPFKIRLESSGEDEFLTFNYIEELDEHKEKLEEVKEFILNILSDYKEYSRKEILELCKGKYGRSMVDSALQSFDPDQVDIRVGERNKKFYQLIEVDKYDEDEEYEPLWS